MVLLVSLEVPLQSLNPLSQKSDLNFRGARIVFAAAVGLDDAALYLGTDQFLFFLSSNRWRRLMPLRLGSRSAQPKAAPYRSARALYSHQLARAISGEQDLTDGPPARAGWCGEHGADR